MNLTIVGLTTLLAASVYKETDDWDPAAAYETDTQYTEIHPTVGPIKMHCGLSTQTPSFAQMQRYLLKRSGYGHVLPRPSQSHDSACTAQASPVATGHAVSSPPKPTQAAQNCPLPKAESQPATSPPQATAYTTLAPAPQPPPTTEPKHSTAKEEATPDPVPSQPQGSPSRPPGETVLQETSQAATAKQATAPPDTLLPPTKSAVPAERPGTPDHPTAPNGSSPPPEADQPPGDQPSNVPQPDATVSTPPLKAHAEGLPCEADAPRERYKAPKFIPLSPMRRQRIKQPPLSQPKEPTAEATATAATATAAAAAESTCAYRSTAASDSDEPEAAPPPAAESQPDRHSTGPVLLWDRLRAEKALRDRTARHFNLTAIKLAVSWVLGLVIGCIVYMCLCATRPF